MTGKGLGLDNIESEIWIRKLPIDLEDSLVNSVFVGGEGKEERNVAKREGRWNALCHDWIM